MSAATTATASARVRGRSVHVLCELIRLRPCGQCPAGPQQACVTGPADGYHLARFAAARSKGLLSEADIAAVLDAAGTAFIGATVIEDTFGDGR